MMFKKLFIIFLFLFLTISIVHAEDNITDNTNQTISENTNHISVKDNTTVAIKTKNVKTHLDSNLYFKAKIYDKNTNKSIKGVKVLFKVYISHNKYKKYSSISNDDGIAVLKKNFKVGSYKIVTSVKNAKPSKSTLTVKPTSEMGCTSIFLQINKGESIVGFRRDSTYAAKIFIKNSKWHGRKIVKQYKTAHSYFFHTITTSDGWMIGNGGADNPSINKAIEKLAGSMVSSNNIKSSYLKKIQHYEKHLGIGHFAIKSPTGKYAIVWGGLIKTGKLKSGEYLKVPNVKSSYRNGNYNTFDSNPRNAAIKIIASDSFGVNRRDATIYYWNSTIKDYKTSSKVTVYGANDNGKLCGRSTHHLKDNIQFLDKNINKNNLPNTPNMMLLGNYNFGNIDKLVKTPTIVKAPSVVNTYNQTKYFELTIKNKLTGKSISGVKINIMLSSSNFTKIYKVKTDNNGIVKINTGELDVGDYNVLITPNNNKYLISAKSTIKIN